MVNRHYRTGDYLSRFGLLVLLTASLIAADTRRSPSPHQRYGPYWTTANGYESTIQIHNNLIKEEIAVIPVLYTSSGAVQLSSIELCALCNASIDVAEALLQHGFVGSQSGALGLVYNSNGADAIGAEVSILNRASTLGYTITTEEVKVSSSRLNSVYLLPSSTSEIYIAVFNGSPSDSVVVHPTAQLESATIKLASIPLGPLESKVISINDGLQRNRMQLRAGAVGGVTLSTDVLKPMVIASGWVEDEILGYSNMMTFTDPVNVHSTNLLGTQILTGHQSNGITVSGHLVLRNTTASSVALEGQFVPDSPYYPASPIRLDSTPMSPGEIRDIDLDALRSAGMIPFDITQGSVKFTYSGPVGAIMGRFIGLSSDKTYGFYSALESFGARSISEIFWSVSADWEPLLTIANFNTDDDIVGVTLTYSGGAYVLPDISLAPLQSYTINVRSLLGLRQPDRHGHMMPDDIKMGGYQIIASSSQSALVVKEHLISQTAKISVPFYGGAVYVQFYDIFPDVTVNPGESAHVDGELEWSDGSTTEYCTGMQVSDTSIGTLSGATCPTRVFTGAQPGATDITARSNGVIIDPQGHRGELNSNTVQVQVTSPMLSCNPISLMRGNTITCTVTGDSVASWSFSGSKNVSGPAGVQTWSGVMVLSGTVTAVGARGETLTSGITVTARGAQQGFGPISAPSPQLVANGSMVVNQQLPTLTSPPDTSPGTMGQSAYGFGYNFQTSGSIGSGPNQGLVYLTSLSDSSAYGWELNPGLTNPSDPFYQHQGNCFPTVQQIIDAVQAHEIGMPGPSHYSQVVAALQSNNPATAAEAVVDLPASINQTADNAIRPVYQAAHDAGGFPEPPTNLPANINYPPYRTCP